MIRLCTGGAPALRPLIPTGESLKRVSNGLERSDEELTEAIAFGGVRGTGKKGGGARGAGTLLSPAASIKASRQFGAGAADAAGAEGAGEAGVGVVGVEESIGPSTAFAGRRGRPGGLPTGSRVAALNAVVAKWFKTAVEACH